MQRATYRSSLYRVERIHGAHQNFERIACKRFFALARQSQTYASLIRLRFALMHEFRLSGMRVGATTAVAIDQIARADAETLGLFGTGKQARCALEAVQLVRPIRRVNVYSPSAGHRAAFAHDMSRDGIDVVAVENPRNVVAGADIVCCATTAMRPVFDGDFLEEGQVVVSIANSDHQQAL